MDVCAYMCSSINGTLGAIPTKLSTHVTNNLEKTEGVKTSLAPLGVGVGKGDM